MKLSNPVYTGNPLHNFVISRKLDLFRRALLLDHILIPKKNMRMPRVHLVHNMK